MTKGPAVAMYTPLISLLLVLALSSHFFQVTDCSRPSPEEPFPSVPHPVLRAAAGDTRAPPAVAEAEGTVAASAATSATAASARDEVSPPHGWRCRWVRQLGWRDDDEAAAAAGAASAVHVGVAGGGGRRGLGGQAVLPLERPPHRLRSPQLIPAASARVPPAPRLLRVVFTSAVNYYLSVWWVFFWMTWIYYIAMHK